jgi:crotonobetainyl-CoA:carnitine CoA-transferase CaiB-like acyl-CoA transferase
VLGRPQWATDARFASNAGRVRNLAQLRPAIAEILLQDDSAAWTASFATAGVPCGPINTVPQVFADAHVRHRGMLRDIAHPLAGTVPQVVSPMRFTEAPLEFSRAPPLLGEHAAEILRELGIVSDP